MKKLLMIILVLFSVFLPISLNALVFNPIEPFTAGNRGEVGKGTQLPEYVSSVYNIGIGVAAILAVIMIIIAGVQYTMSAGKESAVSAAKSRIWNAVAGLLVVLGAWLFLNTLNPEFTENVLCIPRLDNPDICAGIEVPEDTNSPGYSSGGVPNTPPPGPQTGWLESERAIRGELAVNGISVIGTRSGTNPCQSPTSNGVALGCTNVYGLPRYAIDSLIELRNACPSCQLTVTGGTEGGHRRHGIGRGMVDLEDTASLSRYILDNGQETLNQCPSLSYTCYAVGNDIYMDEGDHFHVEFNVL